MPPIVIAIDGTSASGKSTNAKLIAKKLGYAYVDTGAMYRTLAWHCLRKKTDIHDPKAVASVIRRWKTNLHNIDNQVRLTVDGDDPEKEIRTAKTSAAVPHVAAVPQVRKWMKTKQRECLQFGDLVITEIYYTPAAGVGSPAGEWFEVYNPTGDDIRLCEGWFVEVNKSVSY